MNFTSTAAFLWSVADLLRGDYKQSDYGKAILPFTLLRRLDGVLEDTKAAVLKEYQQRKHLNLPLAPFLTDPELRDTENAPLKKDIDAYFAREVKPHAPDAWIDEDKTRVGYGIPFNRHFYTYTPPRSLEVIQK